MGKVKIITKEEEKVEGAPAEVKATGVKSPKKKIVTAHLHIEATFNNTKSTVTDQNGNTLFSSSAGALGFKGAKKGTPFAAGKVGDVLAEKSQILGIKEVDVFIRGVGSGREPIVRSFMAHGFEVNNIVDMTPVPHNGPKPKKPRRV